jgi:hypothetical protein
MPRKKSIVKVHMAELISTELLFEHTNNSQKQSRHVFTELKKSIEDNGFDETLLVRPVGEGYEVVSGNHRFRAGKSLGMQEFPCVIRDDWDDVAASIELVRRNYVRGKIDAASFTAAVDTLSKQAKLPLEAIYENMGFEDHDAFAEYYKTEKKIQKRVAQDVADISKIKMIDDLGIILSTIFENYGHTVPSSFLIFPAGGKKHMYVGANAALKNILEEVASRCILEGLDINVALAGLLHIGAAQTNWFSESPRKAAIVDAGSVEGSGDLQKV